MTYNQLIKRFEGRLICDYLQAERPDDGTDPRYVRHDMGTSRKQPQRAETATEGGENSDDPAEEDEPQHEKETTKTKEKDQNKTKRRSSSSTRSMAGFVQPSKPASPETQASSQDEPSTSKAGQKKTTTGKGKARKSAGRKSPEPSTSTVRGKGVSQGPGKKAIPRKGLRKQPEPESSSDDEDPPGPERVPSTGRVLSIEDREEILRQERAAFEKQRLEFEARVHLFGHAPPPPTGEEETAADSGKPVTREEMEIAFAKAIGKFFFVTSSHY